MPIDKPNKPSSLFPRSFGGEKNNFSNDLIANGFESNTPQTYNGDNLNYQLDATGKELDYCEKVVDYLVNMPVNNIPLVNSNNKLDYIDKDTMLSNFADKSFSNIDDTAKAYFDGEWISSEKNLESNIVASSTVTTYDLVQLGVIPDQNNTYELLYTAVGITNQSSTSGTDLNLIYNGIMPDGSQWVLVRAQTSANVSISNYVSSIFPVRGGIIKVKSNVTAGKRGFYIHAYRRVK